jgi:hypothetical protein
LVFSNRARIDLEEWVDGELRALYGLGEDDDDLSSSQELDLDLVLDEDADDRAIFIKVSLQCQLVPCSCSCSLFLCEARVCHWLEPGLVCVELTRPTDEVDGMLSAHTLDHLRRTTFPNRIVHPIDANFNPLAWRESERERERESLSSASASGHSILIGFLFESLPEAAAKAIHSLATPNDGLCSHAPPHCLPPTRVQNMLGSVKDQAAIDAFVTELLVRLKTVKANGK